MGLSLSATISGASGTHIRPPNQIDVTQLNLYWLVEDGIALPARTDNHPSLEMCIRHLREFVGALGVALYCDIAQFFLGFCWTLKRRDEVVGVSLASRATISASPDASNSPQFRRRRLPTQIKPRKQTHDPYHPENFDLRISPGLRGITMPLRISGSRTVIQWKAKGVFQESRVIKACCFRWGSPD